MSALLRWRPDGVQKDSDCPPAPIQVDFGCRMLLDGGLLNVRTIVPRPGETRKPEACPAVLECMRKGECYVRHNA